MDGLNEELNGESKYNLNTFINSLKNEIINNYFEREKFKDNVFHVSGKGPFDEDDIILLLNNLDIVVNSDEYNWEETDYFIIGNEYYDTDLIDVALNYKNIIFLTQEMFFNMIMFGIDINNYYNDLNLFNHSGMNYLKSIGYEWKNNYDEEKEYILNSEHEIYSKYGYNVKQATRESKRLTSLENAVCGIGLYKVYKHLLYLIKRTEKRKDTRLYEALRKYRKDFSWLKNKYYNENYDKFKWEDR